jgi:hypothetical protein
VSILQRALCWAHLKRDSTKFAERGGRSGEIGDKLLDYVQKMFHLWHQFVDRKMSRPELQLKMAPIRRAVESLLEEVLSCGNAKTERTCKKILKLREALWTFVDVPGVEPTNNVAYAASGITVTMPRPGLCRFGRVRVGNTEGIPGFGQRRSRHSYQRLLRNARSPSEGRNRAGLAPEGSAWASARSFNRMSA